jgi:hypothetical protein
VKEKSKFKVWRPDEANFGKQKDVLSVLITSEQGNYCWPYGFAFDQNYEDYIEFNKKNQYFNADDRMAHLARYV